MRRKWRLRRRRSPHARVVLGVLLTAIALWLAGLVWFGQQVPRRVEEEARFAVTDAIVVLTGGAGRLGTGLELLEQGRAKKLFISGVHLGVDVAEILRVSRQEPDAFECCIEVGYDATNTAGNARETARWMAAEGYRSLRLVTASYHMPRSHAEFRRTMPGFKLVLHPVFADTPRDEAWWSSLRSIGLISSEFSKYLVTMARPGPRPAR